MTRSKIFRHNSQIYHHPPNITWTLKNRDMRNIKKTMQRNFVHFCADEKNIPKHGFHLLGILILKISIIFAKFSKKNDDIGKCFGHNEKFVQIGGINFVSQPSTKKLLEKMQKMQNNTKKGNVLQKQCLNAKKMQKMQINRFSHASASWGVKPELIMEIFTGFCQPQQKQNVHWPDPKEAGSHKRSRRQTPQRERSACSSGAGWIPTARRAGPKQRGRLAKRHRGAGPATYEPYKPPIHTPPPSGRPSNP